MIFPLRSPFGDFPLPRSTVDSQKAYTIFKSLNWLQFSSHVVETRDKISPEAVSHDPSKSRWWYLLSPPLCVCARIGVVYTLFLVKFTISGISFHPSMVSHQDKLETNPSYFHMKNVHWPSLNRIFAELCGLSSLVLFGILKDPPKRDSHFRPAATEAWGTGFPWMVPYPWHQLGGGFFASADYISPMFALDPHTYSIVPSITMYYNRWQ